MSDAPSTPAAPAMGAMGAMCPAGACGVAWQAAGVLEVESWDKSGIPELNGGVLPSGYVKIAFENGHL